MGEARRSASAYFLPRNNNGNQAEISQQRKRPREELTVPSIEINNEDATSSVETVNASRTPIDIKKLEQGDRNAIRHDRLLDKIDRYTSHEIFIRKCIANDITPNAYKIEMEPSIGNHDDEFLKGYYKVINSCSTQLMNYTADYCAKKITEFESQKKTSDDALKAMSEATVYADLQKTFSVNQKKRQKALQEVKDKKFIRLKYKRRQSEEDIREQRGFNRPPATNKHKQDNQPRIERRNANMGRNGDISRKNSNTNILRSATPPQGIESKLDALEKQLEELRRTQDSTPRSYRDAVQGQTKPKSTRPNGTIVEHRYIKNVSKNDNPSHTARDGKENNSTTTNINNNIMNNNNNEIEVSEVLEYISVAMQTLGEFEKRLTRKGSTKLTHSEM